MKRPNLVLHNKSSLAKVAGKTGVYAYYHKNECLYVGHSCNLKERISRFWRYSDSHQENQLVQYVTNYLIGRKFPFRVNIFFYPPETVKLEERAFIKKLKPRLNVRTLTG